MSNDADTYLSVKGDKSAIDNVRAGFKTGEDGAFFFDFEHFLPTPEVLNTIMSPTMVVETDGEAVELNEEYRTIYSQREGEGEVPRRAITRAEETELLGQYGSVNWYDWNNRNWGVKWNSDAARVILDAEDQFAIRITNAWTTPTGLIDHIRSMDGVEHAEYITIHDPNTGHGDKWSEGAFDVFDLSGPEITVRKAQNRDT